MTTATTDRKKPDASTPADSTAEVMEEPAAQTPKERADAQAREASQHGAKLDRMRRDQEELVRQLGREQQGSRSEKQGSRSEKQEERVALLQNQVREGAEAIEQHEERTSTLEAKAKHALEEALAPIELCRDAKAITKGLKTAEKAHRDAEAKLGKCRRLLASAQASATESEILFASAVDSENENDLLQAQAKVSEDEARVLVLEREVARREVVLTEAAAAVEIVQRQGKLAELFERTREHNTAFVDARQCELEAIKALDLATDDLDRREAEALVLRREIEELASQLSAPAGSKLPEVPLNTRTCPPAVQYRFMFNYAQALHACKKAGKALPDWK